MMRYMGLIVCFCLAGCFGQSAPDEFVVVAKPGLELPPEFELRPPSPGQSTKQDINTQRQAIAALFPGRTSLPELSRGERALLSQLGPADKGARAQLRNIEEVVVRKDPLLPDILSAEEHESAREGVTITQGDSSAIKQTRRRRGFFRGLFSRGSDDNNDDTQAERPDR